MLKKIFINILKYSLLLLFIIPIITLVYNSFLWFHKEWYFLLWYWLRNTIEVVLWSILVSLFLWLPSAIILWYYKIKFSKFFVWTIILSLIIPWYTLALLYSDTFNFFFSKIGLIIVLWISAAPYIFIGVYNSLINTSKKYMLTWKSLWLSDFQIIRKIIYPLIKPALLFWIVIVIAETSADFGASFFLWVKTFMVNIYNLYFTIYDKITGSQFALILLFLIFLFSFLLKPFKNKINKFINLKSGDVLIWDNKENLPKNNIQKLIIYSYLIFVVMVMFLIPIWILFYWLYLSRNFNFFTLNYFSPLFNTVLLLILAILIINLISYILIKFFRKNNIIMSLLILSYAIPWLLIWLWLIQITPYVSTFTMWLLILLLWLTIKISPLVIQNLYTQYIKISPKLRKTWYSLWRSRLDYIKKIELPLLKKWFIASSAVIFIEIVRELPLTLILSPFNFSTLSTKIFHFQTLEQIEHSAIIILFMILLTLIPIIYLYKKKIDL